MYTDYWLERELWKQRQNKLDKMLQLEVVEKSQFQTIIKITTWVSNIMIAVRQYLQVDVQAPNQQTKAQSNS